MGFKIPDPRWFYILDSGVRLGVLLFADDMVSSLLLPNIKKKHTIVDTSPFLLVDEVEVLGIGVEDTFKYL